MKHNQITGLAGFFGMTVSAGFFLSDAMHLTFCDGENFLQFTKAQ